MQSEATIILLAGLLHEASRAPTLASNDSGHPAHFIEFSDLNDGNHRGLLCTAASLLAVVEPWCPATSSKPLSDAVDWLANHITVAAHANGPIRATLAALPEEAKAYRRGQATYLLSRFGFRDVPALGTRDNGDPARTSPSAA